MTGIFLGLGSNLGDRLENLRSAVRELEGRGVKVKKASSVYETAPVGREEQPDFLNAVIEVETYEPPEKLLRICFEVEADLGRVREERWGPRLIDLDLLLYANEVRRERELVLPHPRLTERRFVIEPLLELEPGLRLPDGARLDECLGKVANQAVVKNGPLLEAVTD